MWKNVGKKPGMASSFGTLLSVNGAEDEQNIAYTQRLTESARGRRSHAHRQFQPGQVFPCCLGLRGAPRCQGDRHPLGSQLVADEDNNPEILLIVK